MNSASLFAAAAALVFSLTPGSATAQASAPAARRGSLTRWIDLQNATLNLRYRFIDNSAGVTTTKQVQHRESLRARLKFDREARYTFNVGLFSGTRFTSGWNNTGWGLNDAQGNLALRAMFVSAAPVEGIEAQYGGLYIIRGESSEITTYDEDGYVAGSRLTVRRPQELFVDEISGTVAFLSADANEIPIARRVKYLNDRPNYYQILVAHQLGERVGVSIDFTDHAGADTWREAVSVVTPELHVVDRLGLETYQRVSRGRDGGFAISMEKALAPRVSSSWGYASIDRRYHGLNADRFHIGNRVFAMMTFVASPQFTASAFVTRAVGNDVPISQRTLLNVIFSYNALPHLRQTGLF